MPFKPLSGTEKLLHCTVQRSHNQGMHQISVSASSCCETLRGTAKNNNTQKGKTNIHKEIILVKNLYKINLVCKKILRGKKKQKVKVIYHLKIYEFVNIILLYLVFWS